MSEPKFDAINRAILTFIQNNGRAAYADIGAHAGLSVSAVNERLKKLQNAGAIRGYGAILEPAAIGLEVLAYVSVLIDWSVHNEAFLEAVMDMPEVLECHHRRLVLPPENPHPLQRCAGRRDFEPHQTAAGCNEKPDGDRSEVTEGKRGPAGVRWCTVLPRPHSISVIPAHAGIQGNRTLPYDLWVPDQVRDDNFGERVRALS